MDCQRLNTRIRKLETALHSGPQAERRYVLVWPSKRGCDRSQWNQGPRYVLRWLSAETDTGGAMTYHRFNGRLAKLEQQTTGPVDYTHMPAALRRERINALLLKRGVPASQVDATRTRLLSMSTAERQAWLKNPSLGL